MLKIGSLQLDNPLVLAPMAGVTDTCTRRMARRRGAGLAVTEMVSAAGLVRNPEETIALVGRHSEEEPLAVQIFGAEPTEMAEAARLVRARGAALVDINLGCPVRRVCRTGAGAALLLDPARVARIIESVRRSIDCPLTVKMRLGWDPSHVSAPEIARIAEECGADAVTLHPRTRAQGFQGKSDWSWVARLKEERKVPVLGSGDIVTPAMAHEVLKNGVCDGVLIGRAARGNPWMFAQALNLLAGEPVRHFSLTERYQDILQHLEWTLAEYGSRNGVRRARFLLFHYVRGGPGAARFRKALTGTHHVAGLRQLLADYYLHNREAAHPEPV